MTSQTEVTDDAQVDPRPRFQRLREPLGVFTALGLGTLTLALIDPHVPGRFPVCPTQAIFGVDCPGCGGLRATHDLAHGNVAEAFSDNALVVIAAPVVVLLLIRSFVLAWQGRRPARLPSKIARWTVIGIVVLVSLFTLVRNLPIGAFLASG